MKIREIGLRVCRGFAKAKTLRNLDKLHLERAEVNVVPVGKTSLKDYLRLAKHKLTGFVVLTALSGYSLGLSDSIPNSNWPLQLTSLVIGTSLCSASAASINQLMEIPYDFQMPRTRNRPLICHKIPLPKAFAFSLATATIGIGTLALGTNWITALLGASNLVIYSFFYTPLKRISPWNTWIGAIVGAIPPLMGWTAYSSGTISMNSFLLPALLYCWQFPHFFALSWKLRKEYSRAGFEMLSVLKPEKSTLVALRYSLMIPVITSLFYWKEVVGVKFLVAALALDAGMVWNAWKFRFKPHSKTAKRLFLTSLMHLPLYLAFLFASQIIEVKRLHLHQANKN